MKKINITIMGKTGAGKSTLVNSILGEKKAEAGAGQRQTQENKLYVTELNGSLLNLYDTVGLECDDALNKKILSNIKDHIEETKLRQHYDDINIIWYCVNANCERFEESEEVFINSLVYVYEIPFIIVLTQAHSRKKTKKFKYAIFKDYHVSNITPILAEDFFGDEDIHIPAYGVDELIHVTIAEYDLLKNKVQKKKVDLQNEIDKDVSQRRCEAEKVIKTATKTAFTLGCIPGASVLSTQVPLITAYNGINGKFGIKMSEDTVTELCGACIAAIVVSPVFAVPIFSGLLAKTIVEGFCNDYLNVVTDIYRQSRESDLADAALTSKRIKEQFSRRVKKKGNRL